MAIFRPDPLAYLTGQLSRQPMPPSIREAGAGGKFSLDGTVKPFAGNTIICHIDPNSRAHRELTRMQSALMKGPHASNFTFLPPSSFHMTVFQGISPNVIDDEEWPDGIPRDTPRNRVSEILLDRINSLELPGSFCIRPRGLFGGKSLTVEGTGDEHEAALRATRIALKEATGIRPADFQCYTFHITLAYLLKWLNTDCARQVIEFSSELHANFAREVPEILLGSPEFCNFDSMYHFVPIRLLSSRK